MKHIPTLFICVDLLLIAFICLDSRLSCTVHSLPGITKWYHTETAVKPGIPLNKIAHSIVVVGIAVSEKDVKVF